MDLITQVGPKTPITLFLLCHRLFQKYVMLNATEGFAEIIVNRAVWDLSKAVAISFTMSTSADTVVIHADNHPAYHQKTWLVGSLMLP